MEILPGVGWANAIPDANTEVSLTINGTAVRFTGSGYHDSRYLLTAHTMTNRALTIYRLIRKLG